MKQNKKKPIQKGKQQKVQAKKNPVINKIGKQQFLLLFCLLVVVFIAYLPSLHNEFVNYDDIRQNGFIANFSYSKIITVFENYYQGQYAPIPFVLYGIINMMTGFHPFIYNLIAVILHLITIIFVFKFIWSLCSNFRIAFVTAALFGIATMQVDSIAWLAAVYKTCLYSIFFLLSLIAYISYIKTNKKKYIIVSLILFLISCFCKEEQAVSLALAVVAIDLFFGRKLFSKKVILEKIPFFLISVVFGIITIVSAYSFQQVINITSYSLVDRFIYASYALCTYIYKLFIPIKLSMLYPYFPLENIRLLYMIFPLLLLIIIALYGYAIKKKNKFIIFGGFFFILNILFSLALQVIAVRGEVMADRFVYLACIGIFFIVAKGIDILIERKLVKLPVITVLFIAFILFTTNLTYSRAKIWKNSMSIWNDVINKYPEIAIAYYFRGIEDNRRGDYKAALADYSKTIAIRPSHAGAYNNRGFIKGNTGDLTGAIEDFNKAIINNPKFVDAYKNRGAAMYMKGKYNEAISDFNKVIELSPNNAEVYYDKGLAMHATNNFNEAVINFKKAIELKPDYLDAYYCRAISKFSLKDYTGTIEDCENALKLNNNYETAITLKTQAQQQLQKISK